MNNGYLHINDQGLGSWQNNCGTVHAVLGLGGALPVAPHRVSLANADANNLYTRTLGRKQYEISDHLGNVRATLSDRLFTATDGTFYPELLSTNTYYSFGMGIRDLSMQGSYRFGFQGKELDNEIKGEGNSINYKFRMHDPRIGRFFAIDPLSAKYPFYSPYAFSGNRVVDSKELEGKEPVHYQDPYTAWKLDQIFRGEITPKEGAKSCLMATATYGAGGIAAFGGMLAAPVIASELALFSGISWGSLPVIKTTTSLLTAGYSSSSLLRGSAAGFDFIGQVGNNLIFNDLSLKESILNLNMISTLSEFAYPNPLFVGSMSGALQLDLRFNTKFGSTSDILLNTATELTFNKIGDSFISSKFFKDESSRITNYLISSQGNESSLFYKAAMRNTYMLMGTTIGISTLSETFENKTGDDLGKLKENILKLNEKGE